MRLIWISTLSILPHMLLPGTSEAGIMINNLSLSEPGFSAVNGPLGVAESWTAVQFTTGTGTWQFNSLTARFRDTSGLTPDGLQIDVRNDAGANPGGTLLGTLTSTTNIVGEANYSFSPTASISLNGLTNYWLVAKPTSDDSFYAWTITTSGADNGQSGWSLADNLLGTATSGTTWAGSPLPFPQLVPLLSIDATQTSAAVPEPSSVAIVGLSFLGFSIRRRIRHSAKCRLENPIRPTARFPADASPTNARPASCQHSAPSSKIVVADSARMFMKGSQVPSTRLEESLTSGIKNMAKIAVFWRFLYN